jgi:hypothetical protein
MLLGLACWRVVESRGINLHSIRDTLRRSSSSALATGSFRIARVIHRRSLATVRWRVGTRGKLCGRLLSSITFYLDRASRLAISNSESSSGIHFNESFNNQIIS